MVDPKKERDMQEALEANLEPEAFRELLNDLKTDTDASEKYEKLRTAEATLREARPAPAPDSIMQGIMGRIAKPESLPESQVRTSTRALALGLGITAAILIPGLLLASLWILSAFGTGSALSSAALWLVGITAAAYAGLSSLMTLSVSWLTGNPLLWALVLLIPAGALGLRWLARRERNDDHATQA